MCASMCQHVPACAGLCRPVPGVLQLGCGQSIMLAVATEHLTNAFACVFHSYTYGYLFTHFICVSHAYGYLLCISFMLHGAGDTNHGLILPLLKTIMIKRRGSSEIPPTPRGLSVSPLVYEKVYGKDIGARLRTESPERAVVLAWSLHVSSGAWECVRECSVGSPTFPRVL